MGKIVTTLIAAILLVMAAAFAFGYVRIESGETAHEAAPATPAPETADSSTPREIQPPFAAASSDVDAGDQPERPVMQAQIILERLGFSPGVIDGKSGQSFAAAVRGLQEANGLSKTGVVDGPTKALLMHHADIAPTRRIVITQEFAAGPFTPNMPDDPAQQAKLDRLGYKDLMEKLGERFHTTPETLVALDGPGTPIGAGKSIIVPNIGDGPVFTDEVEDWRKTLLTLGVSSRQPHAAKVVVDKSEGVLKAYGEDGKLLAQFPATMGSQHDPLPIGQWTIQGETYNPEFHYNPDLFWDASSNSEDALLPPGPNGPVGVAWLDLSKPHYGIHGTSEPQTIGTAQSHGCIRLTNWDVARLAQMVKPGTPAVFQE